MSQADEIDERLVAAARDVQRRALCPHSRVPVGCALLDGEGRVWTGANVENASYTLGLCAERVALFHALAQGARGFRRAAIVTDARDPTPPCGACRQVLFEFAPELALLLVAGDGSRRSFTIRELLPHGFDASFLDPAPTRP